jgi:hypothetical protein
VGKWRTLFESNLPPFEHREYGEQYVIGSPASEEQLAAAESALGPLPQDVRDLLAEFNGVWYTTRASRRNGRAPDILYLDIEHMTVEVPRYFRTCGNVLPSEEDLRKVVFVCQSNGYGDLWGVCMADVAGNQAGEVVRLDHEVGELEASYPSLAEFVRTGLK